MAALKHSSRSGSRQFSTRTRTGAPYGQHFLTDERIQRRIVEAIHAPAGAVVLEIGAGPGNMTRLLAEHVGRLISVEIDQSLAAKLQAAFADNSKVEIFQGDFLKVSISDLVARHGGAKLLVFGNLPYYITTPILMKLFDSHERISSMVVMMQHEVAERLLAGPGDPEYGLLSVTAQFFGTPKILFRIPPQAFRPPPKVMSALVSMDLRSRAKELGIADEADFWKWLRAAFAQKRKTLVNNWKSLAPATDIQAALTRSGLNERVRAEDLSLTQLTEVYLALAAPRAAIDAARQDC